MLESPFFFTKKANHLKPVYVTLKIKKCKVFLVHVQPISIVINIFGPTLKFFFVPDNFFKSLIAISSPDDIPTQ